MQHFRLADPAAMTWRCLVCNTVCFLCVPPGFHQLPRALNASLTVGTCLRAEQVPQVAQVAQLPVRHYGVWIREKPETLSLTVGDMPAG